MNILFNQSCRPTVQDSTLDNPLQVPTLAFPSCTHPAPPLSTKKSLLVSLIYGLRVTFQQCQSYQKAGPLTSFCPLMTSVT